jgi:hypothetical protein
MATQLPDMKEMFTKAAVVGGIAAGAAFVLTPGVSISIAGLSVPSALLFGVGAGTGSLVADVAHAKLLPLIPHDEKYDHIEALGLSLGSAALGTCLVGMLGPNPQYLPLAALGAVSFVAGDYVYHNVINKDSGGIIF